MEVSKLIFSTYHEKKCLFIRILRICTSSALLILASTSIATCIMVLKKNKSENSTLFIDASKECVKVTNNNKLTEENISRIVETFTSRRDSDYFACVVPNDKIAENDYNLSVSTYVEQEDTREAIDIVKLNAEISEIVLREEQLRAEIDAIIEEIEVD